MSKDYTLKEALSKSSKDLYKAMDEARNAASTPIEVAAANNACWNTQQLIESNKEKKQTREHSLAQRKSMNDSAYGMMQMRKSSLYVTVQR